MSTVPREQQVFLFPLCVHDHRVFSALLASSLVLCAFVGSSQTHGQSILPIMESPCVHKMSLNFHFLPHVELLANAYLTSSKRARAFPHLSPTTNRSLSPIGQAQLNATSFSKVKRGFVSLENAAVFSAFVCMMGFTLSTGGQDETRHTTRSPTHQVHTAKTKKLTPNRTLHAMNHRRRVYTPPVYLARTRSPKTHSFTSPTKKNSPFAREASSPGTRPMSWVHKDRIYLPDST